MNGLNMGVLGWEHKKHMTYDASSMGVAHVEQVEVDRAVEQLQKWANDLIHRRPSIHQKAMFEKNDKGYHLAFDRALGPNGRRGYTILETDNPLGKLVNKLWQQLLEQKHAVNFVGVRFEQGSVRGLADYWHVDEQDLSVTIGFSNMPEWNTKILDNQAALKLLPCANTDEGQKPLDAVAETAKLGHFYNAARLCHRSPIPKDVPDIKYSEYRIFLRFL